MMYLHFHDVLSKSLKKLVRFFIAVSSCSLLLNIISYVFVTLPAEKNGATSDVMPFFWRGLVIVTIIIWFLIKICLDNRTVKSSYLLYALISSLLLLHAISFIDSSLRFIGYLQFLLNVQFKNLTFYGYMILLSYLLTLIFDFCIILFLGNLVLNKGKMNINLLHNLRIFFTILFIINIIFYMNGFS